MLAVGYDEAVEVLRGWTAQPVVVEMQPEGTVMRGRLVERDASGIDGALFAVSDPARGGRDTTGVAIALFRDGVEAATLDGDDLVVRQGRMTLTVRRATCAGRRSARD
jgi:hypothetical protein